MIINAKQKLLEDIKNIDSGRLIATELTYYSAFSCTEEKITIGPIVLTPNYSDSDFETFINHFNVDYIENEHDSNGAGLRGILVFTDCSYSYNASNYDGMGQWKYLGEDFVPKFCKGD